MKAEAKEIIIPKPVPTLSDVEPEALEVILKRLSDVETNAVGVILKLLKSETEYHLQECFDNITDVNETLALLLSEPDEADEQVIKQSGDLFHDLLNNVRSIHMYLWLYIHHLSKKPEDIVFPAAFEMWV